MLSQEADEMVANPVVGLEGLCLVLVEQVIHDKLAGDQYHASLALLV